MTRIFWKGLLIISLGAALLLVIAGLMTGQVAAATLIAPSDDAYVDFNDPDLVHDDQGLDVGFSNFGFFNSVQESYLKFDLSSVTQTTGRSLMNVTITANAFPAGSTLDVSLYGVEGDGWNEAAITWNNPPTGTRTLLQTISVPAGTTGVLTFGSAAMDNAVGTYIENQRAGDGTASFLILLEGGTNLGVFNAGVMSLEDLEDTQTPGTADSPNLEMLSPTAVGLSSLFASGVNPTWLLPAIAAAIILSVASMLMLQRTKRNRIT